MLKGYKTIIFSLLLALSGILFGFGLIDSETLQILIPVFLGGIGYGLRDAIQ